jgi:cytochrome b561
MAVGIYLSTIGLIAQVGRTNHYLKFNVYPVDEWFPVWVLKDVGISIMVFCVIRLGLKLIRTRPHV